MSQVLPPIPEVAWVHDDYVAPPTFEDHEPIGNQPIALPPGPHITTVTETGLDLTEEPEAAGDPPSGIARPVVSSLAPATGPEAGATAVTVTGTGFADATAVKFGDTEATSFTIDSATQITAQSPAGGGTVHVTVTTPGGVSATGRPDEFAYIP